MYEVLALTSTSVTSSALLCKDRAIISQPLCISAIFIFSGSDPVQINTVSYIILIWHIVTLVVCVYIDTSGKIKYSICYIY